MATRFDAVIGQPINLTYQYYVSNALANPYQFQKVEIFRIAPQNLYRATLVETIPSTAITMTSTGNFAYTMSAVATPGQYFDRVTILPSATTTPDFTVTVSLNLSLNPTNWVTDKFINIPNNYNIDGHPLADGDTVLLFGQLNKAQNGVFVYNSTTLELTRVTALDSAGEFVLNDIFSVTSGSRAGNMYRLSTVPAVLNTDPITFQPFADAIFTDQILFQVRSSSQSITGPSGPSLVPICRLYGQIIKVDGTPLEGCLVSFNVGRFPARLNNTAYAIAQDVITVLTNSLGQFYIDLPQGLEVRCLIRDILYDQYIKIPATASYNILGLSTTADVGDTTSNDTTANETNW